MHKRTLSRVALVTLALALLGGGCGGDDEQDEAREATTAITDTAGLEETLEETVGEALEDALTLDLQEQNDSGITGTVEFSPTSEGQVEVEIELTGSEGGPHPAHIHAGNCADLDPTPKWPLEDVVDGRSKTTIDVTSADLVLDEYAVNVHESAEAADNYVACADIRNQ
jgi:Cu/Zn superoxide dismutase